MNILFIYPDICMASGRFHQGIGYISSFLKKNGHKTALIYLDEEISREDLFKKIDEILPDLIAFSSTTNQFPYVQQYASWIKEKYSIPILCGGIHPTILPETVIAERSIDIICIGEGEYPMLELANSLEKGSSYDDIQNLWVKRDDKIYKNPLRPLIENLDDLPFPDRELFNYENILGRYEHVAESNIAEFITGRGCPFNCTYCCNHTLRKIYKNNGKFIRRRSVENVLAEIREVTQKYKVEKILFDDDTFTLHSEWIDEFCDKYSEEFKYPFICNAHPTTITEELTVKLKKAGCEQISIGIESGNEWLRRNVLKRNISDKKLIKAFELVRKAGIRTYSFNIIGLPFETPEMADDTIRLNKIIDPDDIQVSIFYPYPKTELYHICENENWLTNNIKFSYFEEGGVLNIPTITNKQIQSYYRKLHLMSIDRIMKCRYHNFNFIYNIFKKIVGNQLTYKLAIVARKILYKY